MEVSGLLLRDVHLDRMSNATSNMSSSITTNLMSRLPEPLIGGISNYPRSSDLTSLRLVDRHVTAEATRALTFRVATYMRFRPDAVFIRGITRTFLERPPLPHANRAVRRADVGPFRYGDPISGPSVRPTDE